MPNGETSPVRRLLPDMIRSVCDDLDIDCRSYSDDWVFELRKGEQVRHVIGYRFDLNLSAAASIASDKVATYQLLAAHDIPAIAHYLFRTGSVIPNEAGSDIVVKPLAGNGGHDVRLFASAQEAAAYMSQSGIAAWAASPYVLVEREVRTIVLDGRLLLSYEKILSGPRRGLTLFNLGMGATAGDYEPSDDMVRQAAAAAEALGLRLVAVDWVQAADGAWQILEVNDGFTTEHYARTSVRHAGQAHDMYRQIITVMMTE